MSIQTPQALKALFIGALVPVTLFLTGCPAECVDAFDCRDKNTATQTFVCINNKCTAEAPDAGSTVDAGQNDAGTDAGLLSDAGLSDGGLADAGLPFTHFVATLNANQEVPASDSGGTGSGFIDLFPISSGTYPIHFHLEWTGIVATLAHGHQNPGANTGPIVPALDFTADGGAPTSPIDGTATLTLAERDALDRGLFYFNVHDSAHPTGAIRGQLLKTGELLYTSRFTAVDGGVQVVVQADGGTKFDGLWDTTPGHTVCADSTSPIAPGTAFCGPTTNNGFAVTGNVTLPLPAGFDTGVTAGFVSIVVRDPADAGLFSGVVKKK